MIIRIIVQRESAQGGKPNAREWGLTATTTHDALKEARTVCKSIGRRWRLTGFLIKRDQHDIGRFVEPNEMEATL